MKDRWLAVNLSWTVLGLGQFYAGRKAGGAVWLALHVLFLGTVLAWGWIPEVGTAILIVALAAFLAARVACAVHAYRCARGPKTAPEAAPAHPRKRPGNPWKAVFLGQFIPGLGQAYGRRWIRLVVVIVLFGAWCFWEKPSWMGSGAVLLDGAFWSLILLDAFWALRKKNAVSKKWTALCLALILPISGAYPLAKLTQAFLFELYRVPGRGMSPTVREGDRVLSNKCGTWFRPVGRFDVVVFRFPLDESKSFIERVAGLPGEDLMIRYGEIFVRPKGESRFRIARKPPRVQERLWIDPAEGAEFLKDESSFRACWGPWGPFTVGSGRLSVPAEAKFRFLPEIGDGGAPVGDARLNLALRMTGSREEVWIEIANHWGRITARLSGGAGGALSYVPRDTSKGESSVPLPGRLVRGRHHAFDLAVSDGRASVRLDGELLAELAFLEFLEEDKGLMEIPASVSFGARGQGLTVEGLAVGRDLHYRGRGSLPDGEAVAIPDGMYLMLGDNVPLSHDSRGWTRWTCRLKGRAEPVECEGQATTDGGSPDRTFLARLREKYRLAAEPDIGIRSDRFGRERYLFRSDLEGEPRVEPFRFIHRRYITGRIVKVYWPPGRAGPVR